MHRLIFSLVCITAFSTIHSERVVIDENFNEIFADSLGAVAGPPVPTVPEATQEESPWLEEVVFEATPPEPPLVSPRAIETEEDMESQDLQYDEAEFSPDIETQIPSLTDDVDLDEPEPSAELAPAPRKTPFEPFPQELVIDLKNPIFVQGVITTTEGGVIRGQGLRIQARKIEYTNKIENGIRIQKIVAEDDLMMEYSDRAFVGSRLEYDFITKTGVLYNGKTFVDIWFLGGDKIELQADGTFFISNAFVTTCEDQDNTWEINAKTVKITEDKLLSAKNIRFRFFKVPLFWLPSFKSNLKAFSDPPIRYKVVWDKGLGPRLTMRYRIYSWRDLNLFFRLDYRLKRGFGGALESEYTSPDHNTTFVTRSYGAHDKSFPDEKGPHRYRLQGLYHIQSKDERF